MRSLDPEYDAITLTAIGHPPEHRDYRGGDHGHFGVELGRDCKINAFVSIDGGLHDKTVLGDRCFIMKHVHIGHDAILGDDVEIAPHACIGGHVTIEAGVRIGMGAIILPRMTIGSGARIGAGAVVTKNVPPDEVWVGNPARSM